VTPLIDATEMYLRTIWELEEEGITPIRARLVERLNVSAPAVSETVVRLEEEGLVVVHPDRTLGLTEAGAEVAVSVMRKHRLAERLLTDVVGLDWEHVHTEACRWEHVISDRVEARLVELLDKPETCPHGNPIPGLAPEDAGVVLETLATAATRGATVVVQRISEKLQGDEAAMRRLRETGLRPGGTVVPRVEAGKVLTDVGGSSLDLDMDDAALVYVVEA
jgi:DtxR family transcriptional regulator, Mn-dependent transcriptional regulator